MKIKSKIEVEARAIIIPIIFHAQRQEISFPSLFCEMGTYIVE